MGITSLGLFAQLDQHDEMSMNDFFFVNGFQHETWYNTVLRRGGLVTHFPLFDPIDMQEWLQIHDQEHKSVAKAIGLSGSADLSDVDFEDDEQFFAWLQLHADQHDRVNTVLGLL